MDRLLNKAEVCERLQISRATLDRIVAAGELECTRIGRLVRFDEEELERYLDRCCRVPCAGAKKRPAQPGRPKGSKNYKPQQLRYIPGMKVV